MASKQKSQKKIFVLDTNVILYNWKSIYNFEENDIKISIKVIDEIDTFKKGKEEININARKFTRLIDALRKERTEKGGRMVSKLCNGGVSLGEGKGKIEIVMQRTINPEVREAYPETTVDHYLLSMVYEISKEEEAETILVTKDVNLRIKADSLGLYAEDYESEQIKDIDSLYKGQLLINDPKLATTLQLLYKDGRAPFPEIPGLDLIPNMYLILRDGKQHGLARIEVERKKEEENGNGNGNENKNVVSTGKVELVRVEKRTVSGITTKNSEQAFSVDAIMNSNISLVTLYGKDGTGKTLISIACAIEKLKSKQCKQIIISAAIVPVGNKEIGFLPGDVNDKVSPYMQGLFDNLEFVKTEAGKKDAEKINALMTLQKDSQIKIQPLSSIRGRSINNTVFIIDETQNTTPHEMKTAITRAGVNTQVIICGDIEQIDAPYLGKADNGLSHVISKFKGQLMYANVYLEKGERSELATIASELL